MTKHIGAGLLLLLVPSAAFAFPIAAGVVGLGFMGALALPVALLAGLMFVAKRLGASLLHLSVILLVGALCILLMRDYGSGQASTAVLFTDADTSSLSQPIPFPFLDDGAQAKSSQAVTPAEFMAGLASGHFKALKISTYPSLFTAEGQVSVNEFWRNKDVLTDAVDQLGGRVVLVDEFGGIAGSVAESASRNFGLNLGFLQGGSAALSRHGWKMVDKGLPLGGRQVPVEGYKEWIEANPGAFVLGITTDREFVSDGWLFGDATLTLADFMANFSSLITALSDKPVFVVGFETNDSGATPVIVRMLTGAGIDVSYVMPNPEEILIKQAFYDKHTNDSRLVSVEDMKRYIRYRQDVVFLDFSEQPWGAGGDFLKGRYHHLSMSEVAKGKLGDFIQDLDPTRTYIGLAFDRRTAYHALLAGDLLSKRGVSWLGRFTQAGSFSDTYLAVEDLNSLTENAAYFVRDSLAQVGFLMLGCGLVVAALAGAVIAAPALILRRASPGFRVAYCLASFAAMACLLQARWDYPLLSTAFTSFCLANGAMLVLGAALHWIESRPPIVALSAFTPVLPPKAGLLNLAAKQGFKVAKGFVVAAQDIDLLRDAKLGSGRFIVRSAMMSEATKHGATAGIFESYVCDSASEVPAMVAKVFATFTRANVDGNVLVQRYVDADWYGVTQFQDGVRTPYAVCEIGDAEAATSGTGSVQRSHFPIWEPSKAPKLVRGAAQALIALSESGAHSIEFALNKGRLIVLQVNQSKTRACAEKRLIDAAGEMTLEVGSAHPDPLSASIVAALAPGHVLAYGNRRFVKATPPFQLRRVLASDLRELGFRSREVEPDHLVAWIDRASRAPCLSDCSRQSVSDVVAAIKEAAASIGRMNRVASAMLVLGHKASWSSEPRILASSQVGFAVREGGPGVWLGMPVSPLAGFAATAQREDFSADELPSVVLTSDCPLAWVKDAASTLLGVRLSALQPAICSLVAAGQSQQLMDALESQVGSWDALAQMPIKSSQYQSAVRFSSVLLGEPVSELAWRIPDAGVDGQITSPSNFVAGGILLIDRCSMDHLQAMALAKAVIARQGSVTSHLMQHAAYIGMPVIIGGKIPDDLAPGDHVTIKADGEIVRA